METAMSSSDVDWMDNLPDDQMYTFDDIPKYAYVVLNGDAGYVIDKGEHVMPTMDARHLVIEVSDSDEKTVHEKLVNKYLYENKRLWVDWTKTLGPHVDTGGLSFPEPQPVLE